MDNPVIPILTTGFYIAVLLWITVVDLRQRRILNSITLPVILLALSLGFLRGWEFLLSASIGAVIGFLFFFLLYWLGKRHYGPGALGMGDVKLAMLLGAMVGLQHVFTTLALGLLLVGLCGLILLVMGRADRRSQLPFGPFLASAGIILLVWSNLWQ